MQNDALQEIERLKSRLELENEYLREEISQSQAFGNIVGSSPALKKVLEQIDLVASTNFVWRHGPRAPILS